MSQATSNLSVVRSQVIGLLRSELGLSPIQAVNQWDTVYSQEIINAAPGTHRFLIGNYEVEFTKPAIASPVPLNQLPQTPQRGGLSRFFGRK